jgi:hypothetical protein
MLCTAAAAAAVLVLAACNTPRRDEPLDYEPMVPRFLIEVRPTEQGVPVVLPLSGVTVQVNPRAMFAEFDVAEIELVPTDLGPAFVFQLNGEASREFYRLSLTSRGRRVVLTLNNRAVAVRSLEQPVANGVLLFIPEIPEERLPQLLADMRRTLEDVKKEIDRMRGERSR